MAKGKSKKRQERFSLYPLNVDDALRCALNAGPDVKGKSAVKSGKSAEKMTPERG